MSSINSIISHDDDTGDVDQASNTVGHQRAGTTAQDSLESNHIRTVPATYDSIRAPDLPLQIEYPNLSFVQRYPSANDIIQASSHDSLLDENPSAPARLIIKCPFRQCQRKVWLTGFPVVADFQLHMAFHRCQWMIRVDGGRRHQACSHIPLTTEDAVNHLEDHIENDALPQLRAIDGSNRLLYFCPYQTCMSAPYTEKGSTNRSHVHQHIRKHLGS